MKKINASKILIFQKLVVGRKIFLSIIAVMLYNLAFSQTIIRGSVKSESGQGLPDVSVIVSGSVLLIQIQEHPVQLLHGLKMNLISG